MSERLSLLGGAPVRSEPWPKWPERGVAEENAVLEALRHGDWGGYPLPNTCTARFTEAFARRHDCSHGLCVANGTVSLEIALQALGVEPGAEVIVPAYTFEATASAALFAGCTPVFVDIDPESYCIDPSAIEAAISERTQAIVPVHLAMGMADMDRIGEIAERHGLVVLEDCAHAHGARWRERGAGSWGHAGSFSFQTSKLLTAGEGGIVITNDEAVLDRLHALTNCGRARSEATTEVSVVGHNYRMTDLQAALLECQLERMDEQHTRRAANAAALERSLAGIDGIRLLHRDPRLTTRAIYQFVVRYDESVYEGLHRDLFVAALSAEGIPCDGQFYDSLPQSRLLPSDPRRYPNWLGFAGEDAPRVREFPAAQRAAYREAVWLPHHLLLGSAEDAEQIAVAVDKVLRLGRGLGGVDHPEVRRLARVRSQR